MAREIRLEWEQDSALCNEGRYWTRLTQWECTCESRIYIVNSTRRNSRESSLNLIMVLLYNISIQSTVLTCNMNWELERLDFDDFFTIIHL